MRHLFIFANSSSQLVLISTQLNAAGYGAQGLEPIKRVCNWGMSVWHYRAQNREQAKTFDEAVANQTSMYKSAVLSS